MGGRILHKPRGLTSRLVNAMSDALFGLRTVIRNALQKVADNTLCLKKQNILLNFGHNLNNAHMFIKVVTYLLNVDRFQSLLLGHLRKFCSINLKCMVQIAICIIPRSKYHQTKNLI